MESRDFFIPLAVYAPVRGFPSNIAITFGTAKTRVVWLLGSEKSLMIMLSCFDRIPACVRQTDRWKTDILLQRTMRYT